MRKVLFIDRDGTIISEPPDEQVDSLEKLEFIPKVITSLSRISAELEYDLVMVTNQDGLGTVSFPEETFWPAHNRMLKVLAGEGVLFSNIFIDRSLPGDNLPTRKPGTAMLTKYLAGGIDLENSYVIGDRLTDLQLALNIGCNSILFGGLEDPVATYTTSDWSEIYRFLKYKPRKSSVMRKTSETSVRIDLNLDGSGRSSITTGLGFFDHLLSQLPRHGLFDLVVDVEGDLIVDEHHTIEDTALALGQAFTEALGMKKGINRYAFMLPMDDSAATVAVDLGGRSFLSWNAIFSREKVGEMPTEMFEHFFRSFCDGAKCNINISSEGENEHHKIESIFKAFARTMRTAADRSGENFSIPSSKGTL